jgi:hypothetical protein
MSGHNPEIRQRHAVCPIDKGMTSVALTSDSHLHLPDDLTELDRWGLWRHETRGGKSVKVPYQVDGRHADTTNPRTWTAFEEALQLWSAHQNRYSGLAFAFFRDDGLCGVDLDDALDERGDLKSWALGIIERFSDTYIEISPSGQGVKIWARGWLPSNLAGVRVGDGQIEMYDHSRYFTVTSRVFRGAPLHVENHADDLQLMYNRLTSHRKKWALRPQAGGQIPHGRQHNTLVSLCGTLRARGVCDEAIEGCLQIVNQKQCERPGPRENVTRIVRSSRAWIKT